MTEYRIRLFGKFSAERNGELMEGIQARKVQELFSYLLVFMNQPQPRDVICEVLWENQPSLKAKKNLRQALWRLQLALGNSANSRNPEIIADSDWLQINPAAAIWLDIAEFEQFFHTFSDMDCGELTVENFKTIQSTVDLYRGDLLDGWYRDWCLFERERFQVMHLTLLDKLVQYCEIHGHYTLGLAYGTDILRHDHAYERTHRQMMRLYCLAGDRTQALYQYERCAAALRNELDIEASEATKQLYEQIRSDMFGPPSVAGEETTRTLSRMLDRLDHFSDELSQIRFRIEKEVTLLEGISSTPK
jgi:DNA-binding SARP family transcriptional activator